jgi:hypothetical protein
MHNMPSTSQEMIDWMCNYHGVNIDDRVARAYLEQKGYALTKDWFWLPPIGVTLQNMPEEDYKHVLYLIEEWDYGGLTK